jgi:hypothetical protein
MSNIVRRKSITLEATGKGNLFVIFGEPDVELINEKDRSFA